MAETLSQEQIDAMLNSAMSGGPIVTNEVVEEEIKEYDFRSPKKFTKERMKTLDSIFDSYARLLSSYLTGLLRLYCKVALVSIEEQRYFEFNNALPDYVMMGMSELRLDDDEVDDLQMITQLSNSLTFIMIDRLLGGKGEYKDSDRDFTEIEVSIMHSLIENMTALMKDPWNAYVDLTPVLTGIETNSRVVSTIGYDDTMIIGVLEIIVTDTKTLVSICMPAVQLDEIMTKFTQRSIRTGKRMSDQKERERKHSILSGVTYSKLDVTAVLGEVNLDIFDIVNLQKNDIIPLGKSIEDNIIINVGGEKWFDGKMGTLNNRKAVRIENIYHDDRVVPPFKI
ncbi:flagellar motor switch protein FliM [Clostridia bacterium]|nr:flagellar motor switch protein FliM [Clostridia bacterium]